MRKFKVLSSRGKIISNNHDVYFWFYKNNLKMPFAVRGFHKEKTIICDAIYMLTIKENCQESIKSDDFMLHNIEVLLFPININSVKKKL